MLRHQNTEVKEPGFHGEVKIACQVVFKVCLSRLDDSTRSGLLAWFIIPVRSHVACKTYICSFHSSPGDALGLWPSGLRSGLQWPSGLCSCSLMLLFRQPTCLLPKSHRERVIPSPQQLCQRTQLLSAASLRYNIWQPREIFLMSE